MNIFTQLVLVVGKITPQGVNMLGSGFIISNSGLVVTPRHVIGDNDKDLVILAPHIQNMNEYQDLSDTSCKPVRVNVQEIDPIKDITILKADLTFSGTIPPLGSFDSTNIGEEVGIFGFPHCVEGRRCLTFQKAEVGAKVLLESTGIKSKHAVINIQSRPGQSGSLIFSLRNQHISGMLMGAWIPQGGGISLGGINPRELHQTTHCISAEYIKEMM
ncbi:MAG: trypsin-like peptidase domain-containing protein [Planctomycetes bacterium]|nr:trypsin-like peptidase domain-containing protein [Planctomycetota bacterium]